ncbi:hypothetical protein BHU72_02605 [Desulfuribacillus stibiiarsenatis]|uniref:Stage V sporulation protein AB n=1 Tax=Desulfuribacillus stibiiarsenatis TaxID=1390249 RepID=A0A1E5L6S6_9FIRM|nr:stage V sporulation protein AB [Desulfuribacillus stibiiarsenatis]OEH85704.1 hypothetical protein BHU72_02605 [Desulfuribacillus stibiiarsenatis]
MVIIITEILVGFANGIAVGGALAAVLTVLDILPRLAQLTKTESTVNRYATATIFGAVTWTVCDFFTLQIPTGFIGLFTFGLFSGVFIGLLAAGLTEVFNLLPVMTKRLRMTDYMIHFVFALVLGKVSGALFYWVIYVNIK